MTLQITPCKLPKSRTSSLCLIRSHRGMNALLVDSALVGSQACKSPLFTSRRSSGETMPSRCRRSASSRDRRSIDIGLSCECLSFRSRLSNID